jgi:uncharacterized protein
MNYAAHPDNWHGAAGVWWPIWPSKPAGRCSPPLGRFDSFAASSLRFSHPRPGYREWVTGHAQADGRTAEWRGDSSVADYTRIFLRPIASPLPLGLMALACAGLLLALQQVGAFAQSDGQTVYLILVGFVIPLMMLATIFCFLARDTVAATALGLFTGAWLATALTGLAGGGKTSGALGAFLLVLAACMLILIAGASFGKAGPAVVIAVGATRFLITGLYEITGSTGLEHAAAVVGFLLAGTALYSALATEVEDVQGALKLPLGRRARAREALTAPLDRQLDLLEHEAGVRQQL